MGLFMHAYFLEDVSTVPKAESFVAVSDLSVRLSGLDLGDDVIAFLIATRMYLIGIRISALVNKDITVLEAVLARLAFLLCSTRFDVCTIGEKFLHSAEAATAVEFYVALKMRRAGLRAGLTAHRHAECAVL